MSAVCARALERGRCSWRMGPQEEGAMPRQRTLDFRREQLGMLWPRFPERWRTEVLAIYAQLIARAAQRPRGRRGAEERTDE
jgi:hypothetical protein